MIFLRFHEDVIFKNEGQKYGQELIEIIDIKGKIIEVHPTEYSIIDPKMYKPDLVFELEDRIIILEFQSSYVDVDDKKRFSFYSALFDLIRNKSQKDIEVHVLSTIENETVKCYKINSKARFPIFIHSLKKYDGDKFINMMNSKIANSEDISIKELLMISLLCFMDSKKDINQVILNSAVTLTNIGCLEPDIGQFVKGVVLMLCDKFVKDESLNTTVSNLVGGNMKIVEDYAQRKVDEETEKLRKEHDKETEMLRKEHDKETEMLRKEHDEETEMLKKDFVINLGGAGVKCEDIAKYANVSLDFVKQTLSK